MLGDERTNWRPTQFGYQLFGCAVGIEFPVVKLLDYRQQWSALETSRNPFAMVVMAYLQAIAARNDRNRRLAIEAGSDPTLVSTGLLAGGCH